MKITLLIFIIITILNIISNKRFNRSKKSKTHKKPCLEEDPSGVACNSVCEQYKPVECYGIRAMFNSGNCICGTLVYNII